MTLYTRVSSSSQINARFSYRSNRSLVKDRLTLQNYTSKT